VAARATAFAVPNFSVALDLGRLSPLVSAQGTVLLSHGHLDHLSGVLAYLNLRARFHPDEPTRLLAPAVVAEPLRQALAVMPGMESVRKRAALDEIIVAAEPAVPLSITGGTATPFPLDHSVPTLGWALHRDGESRPTLVFSADSTTEPFETNAELLDAEVAIVDCSFIEPNRRIAARLSKHAHILDWLELAPRLTCDALVLSHLPQASRESITELAQPLARAYRGRLVVWAG
jgi:ribonuclease Z